MSEISSTHDVARFPGYADLKATLAVDVAYFRRNADGGCCRPCPDAGARLNGEARHFLFWAPAFSNSGMISVGPLGEKDTVTKLSP